MTIQRIHRKRAIGKNQDGVAFIEFALSVSFLLFILVGAIEVPRFFLIVQKLEKSVATVTDVLTQSDSGLNPLNDAKVYYVISDVPTMMNPFGFSANGTVIVSDVIQNPATHVPTIMWQVCGAGTLGAASALGHSGGAATLPAGFTMTDGEETVFGEIYYNYSPIITGVVLSPLQVYRVSIYHPRFGTLSGYNPTVDLCS